jgi:DNA-binding NarL/FixJ family response regulator
VLEALRSLFTQTSFHVQSQQLGGLLTAKDLHKIPVSPATVYVLDAHAPRPITEAIAEAIRIRYPEAHLILVAEKFDEDDAFALLRLGAKGLLRYIDADAHLVRALETVIAGGFWVPRRLLSGFINSVIRSGVKRKGFTESSKLSPREMQVLGDLLDNCSNKEIAAKLKISERTVKFHVANVLEKFRVGRRVDLVLLWYQHHHR